MEEPLKKFTVKYWITGAGPNVVLTQQSETNRENIVAAEIAFGDPQHVHINSIEWNGAPEEFHEWKKVEEDKDRNARMRYIENKIVELQAEFRKLAAEGRMRAEDIAMNAVAKSQRVLDVPSTPTKIGEPSV